MATVNCAVSPARAQLPVLIPAPPAVSDPASTEHCLVALDEVAEYAGTLASFLHKVRSPWAEPNGCYSSEYRQAFDAWDNWTEIAYAQSCQMDQDFDTVLKALEDYKSWLEAKENFDAWRRPNADWSAEVNEALDVAARLVDQLEQWHPFNGDTAHWTQRAWDRIDAKVQAQLRGRAVAA